MMRHFRISALPPRPTVYIPTPLAFVPQREYHGDPGPSTMRRQNSGRRPPPEIQAYEVGRDDFNPKIHRRKEYRPPSSDEPHRFGMASPQSRSPPRTGPSGPRSTFRPPPGAVRPPGRFAAAPGRIPPKDNWAPRVPGLGPYGRLPRPPPAPMTRQQYDKPTGHQADAFETSGRVTAWIKAHPSPIKLKDLDALLSMVSDAPSSKVNAVVWNQVLGVLGRERRMDKMWRAFNDMKKRGIEPTSRTFTSLINAYARVSHVGEEVTFVPMKKPEDKQLQRMVNVYNQSQKHIAECVTRVAEGRSTMSASLDDDSGIASDEPLREDIDMEQLRADEAEISLGPTNAYMKYLSRHGLWSQLDKMHLAMDTEGALAPDNITYSILFSGLLHRQAQQIEKRYKMARNDDMALSANAFGDRVRHLWDGMVRQFHPPKSALANTSAEATESAAVAAEAPVRRVTREKKLDEELAVLALQAMLRARPSEQRLAISLIPFLWNLPERPAAIATPASLNRKPEEAKDRPIEDIPASMRGIPVLRLHIPAASGIVATLSKCNYNSHAAHYARHFLAQRSLASDFDFAFLRSAIHALSSDGDVTSIDRILNKFQPSSANGSWPDYVWDNALTATRWAGDFASALSFFRRMTHVPHGVEESLPAAERTPYKWSPENSGYRTDMTGMRYRKPDPVPPTAKTLSLLFKTAFGSGGAESVDKNVRMAFNLYSHFPIARFFTLRTRSGSQVNLLEDARNSLPADQNTLDLRKDAEWRLMLMKDVQKAAEIMLENSPDAEEKVLLEQTKDKMGKAWSTWAPVLDVKAAVAQASEADASAPVMASAMSAAAPKKNPAPEEEDEDETSLEELEDGWDWQ